MAYTLPTLFEAHYRNRDTVRTFVAKIYDGTNTWYVSDRDMILTDGHVYPLVVPGFFDQMELTCSVNLYSRRPQITAIDLKLINLPYTGDRLRLSDQGLCTSNGLIVDLYAVSGNATALTDCLLIFRGYVRREPTYTETEITLSCEDRNGYYENTPIPNKRLANIESSHPTPDRRLAFILGDWTGANTFGEGINLAKAYGYNNSGTLRYFFADHTIHTSGTIEVWIRDASIDAWVKADQTSMSFSTATDTGDDGLSRTVLTVAKDEPLDGWLYLLPSAVDNDDHYEVVFNYAVNNLVDGDFAFDRNPLTYAEMYAQNAAYFARASFRWENYDTLRVLRPAVKAFNNPVILLPGDDSKPRPFQFFEINNRYQARKISGWTISETDAYLIYRALCNPDLTYAYGDVDPYGEYSMVQATIGTTPDSTYQTAEDDSTIFDGSLTEVQLYTNSTTNFADNVGWWPSDAVFRVHFLTEVPAGSPAWYLRIYNLALRLYVAADLPMLPDTDLWVACPGMMIGSTIATRISGTLTDTAVRPAHQAELVLRSVCPLDSSSIDDTSIDGLSATPNTKFILDEAHGTTVGDFLQEISENSAGVIFFDPAGSLRALDFTDTGSTYSTINYTDLLESPAIWRTDEDQIINDLTYSFDFDHGSNQFRQQNRITNSTSISTYGTRPKTARLRMLDPLDYADFESVMMTGSQPLWPLRHWGVTLRTGGHKWIHLQEGDFIALDATSTDPHILLNGSTWASNKFMVFEKTIKRNEVIIKAMQLT